MYSHEDLHSRALDKMRNQVCIVYNVNKANFCLMSYGLWNWLLSLVALIHEQ